MKPRSERELYDELCAYTMSLRDGEFIHQHVVDAWAAQHVEEDSKPIGVAFALVGLFLHLEKGWSGREVQRAHMRMAKEKKPWPRFGPPSHRGDVTVRDVMSAAEGNDRSAAIDRWCASVWDAWKDAQPQIRELATKESGGAGSRV